MNDKMVFGGLDFTQQHQEQEDGLARLAAAGVSVRRSGDHATPWVPCGVVFAAVPNMVPGILDLNVFVKLPNGRTVVLDVAWENAHEILFAAEFLKRNSWIA
jgi:hypothetical protein